MKRLLVAGILFLLFVEASAQPPPLIVSKEADSTCVGMCNGTATLTPLSGIPPYTYVWDTGDSTATIDSLCAGTYFYTVCDQLLTCNANSITIGTSPDTLKLTTSVVPDCGAGIGDASVSATGAGPFTYLWSTSDTTASISGLTLGSYCVSVSDTTGCMLDTCVTVDSSSAPTLVMSSTPVTCNGDSDGTANASPGGGTPPYSYVGWPDSTITGLSSGMWYVTVTDSVGCSHSDSVFVSEPTMVVATISNDTTL